MNSVLIWFWAVMIFASIAWYAILLFTVGIKGGYEIVHMARSLSQRPENEVAHDGVADLPGLGRGADDGDALGPEEAEQRLSFQGLHGTPFSLRGAVV